MSIGMILVLYAGMAAVTYLSRRLFLQLPSGFFSPRLKNALSFIPIGIFAALIFPSLFVTDGHLTLDPVFLAGSLVCLAVMAWSKNVLVSFGVSLLLVVLVYTKTLPFPF